MLAVGVDSQWEERELGLSGKEVYCNWGGVEIRGERKINVNWKVKRGDKSVELGERIIERIDRGTGRKYAE